MTTQRQKSYAYAKIIWRCAFFFVTLQHHFTQPKYGLKHLF